MKKYLMFDGAASIRFFLYVFIALPPVYIFFAIQYSAITVPFWDHCELIRWITSWYDGNFYFSSLWAPHNHTRPLVYRSVMLFNAVLTDWDIRSEYIYLYLVIFGGFFCHVAALRKITMQSNSNVLYPAILLLISLFYFSPVGHNNHWWSMMFQLDAANLFIVIGLLLPFLYPQKLSSHIFAAISCWLASYTLTNGIFALIAVLITFQLSSNKLVYPNRWAIFWGANLLVLMISYLPGISLSESSAHPSLLQLFEFCLAYLGSPLAGLIKFPFKNMFWLPTAIVFNAICGALLLVSWSVAVWRSQPQLRQQKSDVLILIGFGIFALISALATGWGRAAFDEYGVSNGNSSRYSIFGVYLILGQLYYWASYLAHNKFNQKHLRYITPVSVIFIIFATVAYINSINVYKDANNFNKTLMNAYIWGLETTELDKRIYPNIDFVKQLKANLQRLELGPYNSRPYARENLALDEVKKIALLSDEKQVSQQFIASQNGLKAVVIKFVTPNGKQNSGEIFWQFNEAGKSQAIAQGKLETSKVHDWGEVRLKLPYLGDSMGHEFIINLSSATQDQHSIGIALSEPKPNFKTSINIKEKNGASKTEVLSLAIGLDYTK